LKPFVWEVGKWALVFGLALAGPVSLHALTPGPIAFSLAGIEFSTPGLFCGGLLLLRLATGIALTLLWRRTTPWRLLLASLRRIGVPGAFLTMAMLAYRYLFVSLETAAEMAEATTSRMVGACDRDQARLFAGSRAATLFAKSLTLMEETHMAMRSRCFESTHQHAL
jgi:energy-coupling factor transporter transmembrane protein EcfT